MKYRPIAMIAGVILLTAAFIAYDRQNQSHPAVSPLSRPATTRAATNPYAAPNSPSAALPPQALAATATTGANPASGPDAPALPGASVPGGAPDTAPLPLTGALYVVQPGDTLLGIAVAHGVSMASLQIANGLGASTLLMAGETLTIPVPRADESPFWIAYTLAPGDTLYGLAQRYQVSVDDLTRVNHLDENSILAVGHSLVIPAQALVAEVPPAPPTAEPPTEVPTVAASATSALTATLVVTSTPEATSTPELVPSPTATIWPTPSGGGNAEWAYALVALINQARAANGLPALAYNAIIAQAAQAHADDCSQRGYGGHVGSDGADLRTRLTRAGYSPMIAWGENWAWSRDPQSAFERWFDEPPGADPHRRNILNTRYAEIGIGIAPASATGWYFIADFGHH